MEQGSTYLYKKKYLVKTVKHIWHISFITQLTITLVILFTCIKDPSMDEILTYCLT
jgi:hypothetical protein